MNGPLLAVVLLAHLLGAKAGDDALPFAKLAQSFREAHGLKDTDVNDAGLQKLLDTDYASIVIGYFDVRYPAAFLGDPKKTVELVAIAGALIDLEQHWLAWLAADMPAARPLDADAAMVGKWLKGWKTAVLASIAHDVQREHDLFKLMSASDEITSAARRLTEFLTATPAGGAGKPQPIVLSPTRGDFIGLAAFVGAIDDEARRFLWVPSLPVWTEFYKKGLEVLAFEYGSATGDITRGTSMNGRDKNGLLQHACQKACETLLNHCFGSHALRRDLSGLGTNLVIEVLGENNARGEENAAGRAIGPTSQFVAGGNANGGQLKRENADSRFRESKGKDHFLVALRTCQRQGASLARAAKSTAPEHTAFALTEGGGRAKPCLIQAPFLGGAAEKHVIPDEFTSDYLEFLRAYRSAFSFWLATTGARDGSADPPAALFARFLHALATGAPLDQVYDLPLTSEGGSDSLESRFLQWLAEGK
ncbi:MAG: hypothetical protein U1E76_05285 [Planctomycetota bacterium]